MHLQFFTLASILTADTRSLLRTDTSGLILMPLYRETKNLKQPIQMYCSSRYKCSLYSDAFPKELLVSGSTKKGRIFYSL